MRGPLCKGPSLVRWLRCTQRLKTGIKMLLHNPLCSQRGLKVPVSSSLPLSSDVKGNLSLLIVLDSCLGTQNKGRNLLTVLK